MTSYELKIERAKHHLQELKNEVVAFFGTDPYKFDIKINAERKPVYFISEVAPTPDKMAVITGEAIACLRSALDNAAYQLVLKGTGAASSSAKIYFPISDDVAKYNANKTKMLNGATPAAIAAIDAMQPYNGGNTLLWQLNKLNNIDKHRLLITVGSSLRSVDLLAYMIPMMNAGRKELKEQFPEVYKDEMPDVDISGFFVPADRLFPLKAGDELLIGAIDDPRNPHMRFKFEVGFNEPEAGVTNGEALITTLETMIHEVEKIVTDLKPHL